MRSDDPVLIRMVSKLATRSELDPADVQAILTLPYKLRTYEPARYLIREGEPAKPICAFVLSGLAFRQKLSGSGARQIVSIHMAGDFLDLQHLFLKCADHNVQALTRIEVAEIARDALQALVLQHPNIGRAMWIDSLIEASIFREWVMNVGRRDARARIAHLLCEFAVRMRAAGIAEHGGYELPVTQEQLGDAVGLTSVHVNRTLKALTDDGIIHRDKRFIGYTDWERLRAEAEFSAIYLHLDQSVG